MMPEFFLGDQTLAAEDHILWRRKRSDLVNILLECQQPT